MAIIDSSFFILDCFVAQRGQPAVVENLNLHISRYEPRFFGELLGLDLYNAFKAGLAVVSPATPEQRWIDLRDGKQYVDPAGKQVVFEGLGNSTTKVSPAANYIYYWYQRGKASTTTGSGEVLPYLENGIRFSPANKMVQAWGEMVRMNYSTIHFLRSNAEVYPEWQQPAWQHDEWAYFFENWLNFYASCSWWWPQRRKRPDIFTPINSKNI